MMVEESYVAEMEHVNELLERSMEARMLPSAEVENVTVAKPRIEEVGDVFLGDMDEADRALNPPVTRPHVLIPLNKEAYQFTDNCGHWFAGWVEESRDGDMKIELIQNYENGQSSKLMSMNYGDLALAEISKNSTDEVLQKEAKRFYLSFGKEYRIKYRGGKKDAARISDITEALVDVVDKLPRYSDDLFEVERVTFYQTLIPKVNNLTSEVLNEHKAYFTLTTQDLTRVAQNLGLNRIKLLEKLKEFGFLYLTPSSKGYQTYVRLNGTGEGSFKAWRYCIIRNDDLANTEEYLDDWDF